MKRKAIRIIMPALGVLCFVLGALVFRLTGWYLNKFDTSFAGLLFTLTTPMQGVGGGFWDVFKAEILPPLIVSFVAAVLVMAVLWNTRAFEALGRRFPGMKKKIDPVRNTLAWIACAAGLATLVWSVFFAWGQLKVGDYLKARSEKTQIYEENYVDPDSIALTAPADKPNVIWLVLESMETTYASAEDGGRQAENLMPNLTRLARENVSFSNSEKLGGFRAIDTTGWTMAALFAGSSGLPFGFPVEQNSMNKYTEFAPAVVALGDVLKRDGYTNEFICGSDGEYGGRALYFRQHGDYEIYDLFTARKNGDIPPDYYEWWGFEDRVLFRIAKQELTRLGEAGKPFNLTFLTVDSHHIGGYTCPECGTEYENRTANVIACTDRQVGEFVEWCREQPFWENTVLVITGDHPRMDTILVEGVSYRDRTIYNCFLNARKQPAGSTVNREAAMMDIYPSILSAMGYTIGGDRLALGTDLFSGRATLMEEMGYDALNGELLKYSEFFMTRFAN